MLIRINGQEKEIEDGLTISALLSLLNIRLDGVAVDLNREIVPRRALAHARLKEGDCVEIVRMTGGG
ncbi:MAG: sulfur carrier protein ThiS [Deltaproteobacteria bacterium]|nr:sulfur carrier protein ThiS [Deltaproteobacteria bacterium]